MRKNDQWKSLLDRSDEEIGIEEKSTEQMEMGIEEIAIELEEHYE